MMYKRSLKFAALAVLVLLMSFSIPPKKIKIYLIGDSTMSVKDRKAYPETGWGMPFVNFFDQDVEVDNRAQNGRSTKSFLAENRWQPVVDSLKAGDYVFVQFGHNDESKAKVERYTTIDEFKANLLKYISETRSKKANPVLLTPVSRRQFNASGKVVETHAGYSEAVREVAKANNVPLIDLDQKSMELYQKFGNENSKLLFLQLEAGVHPNYPEGKIDNTHFNELGAREIAQVVLKEIRTLNLDLVNHIIKPVAKK
ncbi:rhamnogalacturonan acetylesterase [Pedobacter sp. MC2016-14]|uniref:rhamnogalacturonan acetylesterase n=1 Tax=Pedobacter sp. MC2016-14 TaxID=2897327 RepID=UPI001E4B4EDD|nr:rhamnogalacturonan acetylesterase [Pedobacter sp. MC2016-14]MCD0488724.1 rhamnogalacturonan acetylesterase [Pedobacter sp. MC2016-14]